MHPFWAVDRMIRKQLQVAEAKRVALNTGEPARDFNCKLKVQSFSSTSNGVLGLRNMSTTRVMDLPVLTNHHAVQQGQELLLEIDEKAEKEKRPRTWRHAMKAEQMESRKKLRQSSRPSGSPAVAASAAMLKADGMGKKA